MQPSPRSPQTPSATIRLLWSDESGMQLAFQGVPRPRCGLDSESRQPDVDGSATTGDISRTVRSALRNATREDASASIGGQSSGLRGVGLDVAEARDQGREGDRWKTCLRNNGVCELSRHRRHEWQRAVRSRPDALDEPPHHRGRRSGRYTGKPAFVDSEPGRHQDRIADAGHETKRSQQFAF